MTNLRLLLLLILILLLILPALLPAGEESRIKSKITITRDSA